MTDQVRAPLIHAAMCAIKAELAKYGGVTKSHEAAYGDRYKFRGIDDLYNALCSLSSKHQVNIIPRVQDVKIDYQTNAKGNPQTHVHLVMETFFISAVDGSDIMAKSIGEAIDTGDKASGKAQSYAMKMALIMAFQIPTHGESMDTEAYEVQVGQNLQPANQNAPAPQAAPPPAPASTPRSVAKPGPKKAKAAPAEVVPINGTPIPPDAIEIIMARIGEVNTFPLLYAVAQDANATVAAGPVKNGLYRAIGDRAIFLFGMAKSLAEVKEGFPLVKAMGEPKELKEAANRAYAKYRNGPGASA